MIFTGKMRRIWWGHKANATLLLMWRKSWLFFCFWWFVVENSSFYHNRSTYGDILPWEWISSLLRCTADSCPFRCWEGESYILILNWLICVLWLYRPISWILIHHHGTMSLLTSYCLCYCFNLLYTQSFRIFIALLSTDFLLFLVDPYFC